MTAVLAYIGLGSNLHNPVEQIRTALKELDAIGSTFVRHISSLYQSKPMLVPGITDEQPDYINAVASVETILLPDELLDALQEIENRHQRTREIRWGARTLDLDLLLYGDLKIQSQRLTVPHPGLTEREFVLVPLLEIDAGIDIPGKGKADQFMRSLEHKLIIKVNKHEHE